MFTKVHALAFLPSFFCSSTEGREPSIRSYPDMHWGISAYEMLRKRELDGALLLVSMGIRSEVTGCSKQRK